MLKKIGITALVLGLGFVGVLFTLPPAAQEIHSQTVPVSTPDKDVSESELQLFIDVYKAMQADHGLKIEQVLASRGVALDDFRSVERRVQSKSLLVERARTALTDYAKQQPVLAPQHPTAGETPATATP